MLRGIGDAPFLHPGWQVFGRAGAFVHEKLGDIKADAACADDGDTLADGHLAAQHVDVIDHVGAILARNVRIARNNPGGDDNLVEACKGVCRGFGLQFHGHAKVCDHGAVPVHETPELFLAGYLFGHVQLPADFLGAVEKSDLVAALRCGDGQGQPGRPCAYDCNRFDLGRRLDHQFGFITGARIDQTAGNLA